MDLFLYTVNHKALWGAWWWHPSASTGTPTPECGYHLIFVQTAFSASVVLLPIIGIVGDMGLLVNFRSMRTVAIGLSLQRLVELPWPSDRTDCQIRWKWFRSAAFPSCITSLRIFIIHRLPISSIVSLRKTRARVSVPMNSLFQSLKHIFCNGFTFPIMRPPRYHLVPLLPFAQVHQSNCRQLCADDKLREWSVQYWLLLLVTGISFLFRSFCGSTTTLWIPLLCL